MKKLQTKQLGKLSFLSLLCLAACGQKVENSSLASQASTSAIIDGKEVSQDALIAKTTVAVYNQAKGGLCTGTLIAKNMVLTAAHCTIDADRGDLVILFGTDLEQKGLQGRRVLGGAVPAAYVKMMSQNEDKDKDWQDMSIVKFEGGDLPSGFEVASLLQNTAVLSAADTVMLAGYGVNAIKPNPKSKTGYDGSGSGVLRQTSVTLKDAGYSPSEILVTMTNGQGACHGDSGGPAYLVRNGAVTVVGVTSRANSPTGAVECNGDTVYTSVPGMMDFIKKAAKYLQSPQMHMGEIAYF